MTRMALSGNVGHAAEGPVPGKLCQGSTITGESQLNRSTMKYAFYTCDVFTGNPFGGNPLAVLPEAEGLSDAQMQQIAREFNFSETTFVLPARTALTRRVRIFTPIEELPFAGHPNIGTAFVLASTGYFGKLQGPVSVVFEEPAGTVSIDVSIQDGAVTGCELKAPQALSLGECVDESRVAAALSLDAADIVTSTHPPQTASVGLPFLMVEVVNHEALARTRCNLPLFEALTADGIRAHVHVYTRDGGNVDIRARMFAPTTGVPEDPATGSANCALAGMLAHYDSASDAETRLAIAQGVEMGRPSLLEARTEKRAGVVTGVWIGGRSVLLTQGVIGPHGL